MTSFLFLATANAPFGEAVSGVEVALAAHAAGDRVVFLHHSRLAPVFAEVPFPRGTIDAVYEDLVPSVRDAVRARGIETIVLVDAVSTFGAIGGAGIRALQRSTNARVVALDLWSCHETNLTWDMGEIVTKLDPVVAELPCLRPCPVAKPDAPGAYRALPSLPPVDRDERRRTRAQLGIADDERIIFTASGAWQSPGAYPAGSARQLAAAWPSALDMLVRRVQPARVLHVGPQSFGLGDRYIHVPQVPRGEFQRLVAASDLVLTNNVMATSLATALALDIPAIAVRNTRLDVPPDAPADVRAWSELVSLRRFAVIPLGLHELTAPVIAGNPYFEAVELAEILQPDETAARMLALLDGDARERRAAYRDVVAGLPSAVDRLHAL